MIRQPKFYTECEGEYIREWSKNAILLPSDLRKRNKEGVQMGSVKVFSLFWRDPRTAPYGQCERWDCINGFTN